jgi:sporulation protein YlmC with PRC-barrel domain
MALANLPAYCADVKKRRLSTTARHNIKENKYMTRKLQFIFSASAASAMALSALAQDTPYLKTDGSDKSVRATRAPGPCQLKGAAKASHIIGMTVENSLDEKLGKVNDLAVDLESGRIVQVILATGGFLGVDDTLTAVPPEALRCDADHKTLRLEADKEKLKCAPKFKMSKWGQYSDSDHLAAVYRYYGEEPAFTFVQVGEAVSDGPRKNLCLIPESRLGQLQKASKLMGTPVRNLQDEKLGSVQNILVDLPSGRVVTVIVSSGGFLGMDGELSAIPPTALRFTTDRETLRLDASKATLANAPHFKAKQWPDFTQPGYTAGVYQAYNVEPYFANNAATEPDNTARNVRDRNNRTLTPFDQGASQADLDTTAQIRKEIIAGKDLSMDAHNVKIITIDGRVTLRGPVDNTDEKRLIGEIASRIAPSGHVDNQLQVKFTASNN